MESKLSLSNNSQKYLEFLKDIYEVSQICSTKTYIWGGFTLDIFEGKFLREHSDLDGFVENLMDVIDHLILEYEKRGYKTEIKKAFNILVIKKHELHAAFNPLDIDGIVAMWRHIGDQGTVYFPYSWVDKKPRDFYNTKVYTSGLCFEYGFRKIACLVNPMWKERDKDRVAKEYLIQKIKETGLDSSTVLKSIWSYNPFWIERGYSPFEKPTLVVPEKD